MVNKVVIKIVWFGLLALSLISAGFAQNSLESRELIATVIFEQDSYQFKEGLEQSLKGHQLKLQDPSIVAAAKSAINFPNLINLSRQQARNLGAALGVDLIIIGRVVATERIDVGSTQYAECFVAIAMITTRNGSLVGFDFIDKRASSIDESVRLARQEMQERAISYTKLLQSSYYKQFSIKQLLPEDAGAIEPPVEDIKTGSAPPIIISRKQPEYTEEARKMGFSAVVELEVVLRSDATIGDIEVVRWAGFGLDETAKEAVRQVKFKPATINKEPVNCRALFQYKFNYRIEQLR